LNLRHFEVTAAGGFLLTYEMSELSRYFEVGKECVAFRTERDLLDKIRYYLAHPKERIEIALAGQKRTLRDHLYSYRIKRLIEQLGDRIKPRGVAALANAGA
jgi:spore maturation protein CgeB